jgi:hypothetical protein
MSPFKALYGQEPNFGAIPDVENEPSPVSEMLSDRTARMALLTKNLQAAQVRMKSNADKNRVEREYSVGDKVILKLRPYAQTSVVNRPYPKLAYKFFGPFIILEKIGKVAYLPTNWSYRRIARYTMCSTVSQLKEYRPDCTPVFSNLPKYPSLDAVDTEPELVLDRRLVRVT